MIYVLILAAALAASPIATALAVVLPELLAPEFGE